MVTLEPDASNFAMLQRNTQGFDKVHLLQAGLWGRQANITLAGAGSLGMEWGKVRKGQAGPCMVGALLVTPCLIASVPSIMPWCHPGQCQLPWVPVHLYRTVFSCARPLVVPAGVPGG